MREEEQVLANNLQLMFQESPEAIFAVDENGRFIFANSKWQELLGYDFKKLNSCGKKLFFDDGTDIREYFFRAVNGLSVSFTVKLKSKTGKLIPADMYLLPVMTADRSSFVLGICKTHVDRIIDAAPEIGAPGTIVKKGAWTYDKTNEKFAWSKELYEIYGADPASFAPELYSAVTFMHYDDRESYKKALRSVLEKGESTVLLYRILNGSGNERYLLERIDAVRDESGKVTGMKGSVEEIRYAGKMEETLTISKNSLLSIADHLHAAIWSYNTDLKRITFCTSGVKTIFGIDVAAFMENPEVLLESVYPDDVQLFREVLDRVLQGEKQTLRFRMIDDRCGLKWIHAVYIPVLNEEGNVTRVNAVFQDITKEKNYTEALSRLAYFDNLTKLPNRYYFEEYVNNCIEKAKKKGCGFAVFYIDLNKFDYINDTYGHEVGDMLLVAVARRLRSVHHEEVFLARIAGDEFVMLVGNVTGVEEALPAAKKIIKGMGAPFYIEGYELTVTVSIGISFYPSDGEDPATLLKNAHYALKRVQYVGKNDWQIYSLSMDVKSYKSFQLEKDLHKALENREFFLVYQPKIDTWTRKIAGAEALIRWEHPDWGTVSPGEFIQIAEENGFIFDMGDWVLQKVCESLGKWKKEKVPLVPVSVNISPKRLLKQDFVELVKGTISKYEIDPGLIELELTEYVLLKDIDKAKEIISELKEFGVKFALDDFGTGFSSLSYLMDLDFDILKIDKSFIDGIGSSKTKEGIIKSMIYLGKELGLQIVAEGVQTPEQYHFLLTRKCHQIQGFLFSKPVSEEKLKEMLKVGTLDIKKSAKVIRPVKNRRKYRRLRFDFPLQAEMTLLKFKEKNLNLGMSKVLIKDISLGGLRYLSDVNLPVHEDFILLFVTEIFREKWSFTGRNVWKMQTNGLYEYGVEFVMSEEERARFAPVFNVLVSLVKANLYIPERGYLPDDVRGYFDGR